MTDKEWDEYYDNQQKEAIKTTSKKLKDVLNKVDEIITDLEQIQFKQSLKNASKVVQSWPEWKQNILGGSSPRLDK